MDWAIILAVTVLPQGDVIEDSFDCLELNHRYNDDGTLQFSQWIGWDFSDRYETHICQAWRLVKPHDKHWQDYSRKRHCVLLPDDSGTRRLLTATRFFETHSMFDPEMQSRAIVGDSERRGLMRRSTVVTETAYPMEEMP